MESKLFDLYNKVIKSAGSWYRISKDDTKTASEQESASKVSQALYAVAEEIRRSA